jgi:low affinity Fe/Cu permease
MGANNVARNRPNNAGKPRAAVQHDVSIVDRFRTISDRATDALGTPWALLLAFLLIAVWALTGPIFQFSDSWQLVINTTTTIITFLMVFVIQTSQNRQAKAMQFKLDELIKSIPAARNKMIEAEHESTDELKQQEEEFEKTAKRAAD